MNKFSHPLTYSRTICTVPHRLLAPSALFLIVCWRHLYCSSSSAGAIYAVSHYVLAPSELFLTIC